MIQTFRPTTPPDGKAAPAWRSWNRAAFDEAAKRQQPVLLNLTTYWCQACREMDETTFTDPELLSLMERELVPIRVDADWYPHIQDRYIAGGWPTNAFLTPTGEVLWAGTFAPAATLVTVARSVIEAWRERRAELEAEIERRRKAIEAARSRKDSAGLVRREAADDVLSAAQDSFDVRNGGFGTEPKFPQPEAIEVLLILGRRARNPDWVGMAERTLDGMLAGELWDPVDGGFFRYAAAADWTRPRREKLLETNAGLLRAYALGAAKLRRQDWRKTAEATVDWVSRTLRLPNGLWGGSQRAAADYFAGDADARRALGTPPADPSICTHWNAQWIRALADAGAWLGQDAWIDEAAAALDRLLEMMAAPGDLLHHYAAPDGTVAVPGLLIDTVECGRASMALAHATGRAEYLEHARRMAASLEQTFWSEHGGFVDHVRGSDEIGALRLADRPFEMNAAAAALLLDVGVATAERGHRGAAERTLALLSPVAGRYGVAGATFALAVDEFFDPPTPAAIAGGGRG